MKNTSTNGVLLLEDGSRFVGQHFGSLTPAVGEVVFNTGMVGYTEALTDPSYRGQILVLTYPLVGNYGVPDIRRSNEFESGRIQVAGLIVSDSCSEPNHWNACRSLSQWLQNEGVPALASLDTRALTKRLRMHGTMMGSIGVGSEAHDAPLTNRDELVAEVTPSSPVTYSRSEKNVVLIDCGCKESILRNLLDRNITVRRVPYDYDFRGEDFDGLVISNGPGDPKVCTSTIAMVRSAIQKDVPIFGICLGSQILALAAGGDTFKMKFGHRGQNQPCIAATTQRCYITSQNHGYAVNPKAMPSDWEEWFVNANDGTNEGVRHRHKPFYGVQFHPEAAPGPTDANFLFDEFVHQLRRP
jgi:carbamoyl-phosphate synthase small subunit